MSLQPQFSNLLNRRQCASRDSRPESSSCGSFFFLPLPYSPYSFCDVLPQNTITRWLALHALTSCPSEWHESEHWNLRRTEYNQTRFVLVSFLSKTDSNLRVGTFIHDSRSTVLYRPTYHCTRKHVVFKFLIEPSIFRVFSSTVVPYLQFMPSLSSMGFIIVF